LLTSIAGTAVSIATIGATFLTRTIRRTGAALAGPANTGQVSRTGTTGTATTIGTTIDTVTVGGAVHSTDTRITDGRRAGAGTAVAATAIVTTLFAFAVWGTGRYTDTRLTDGRRTRACSTGTFAAIITTLFGCAVWQFAAWLTTYDAESFIVAVRNLFRTATTGTATTVVAAFFTITGRSTFDLTGPFVTTYWSSRWAGAAVAATAIVATFPAFTVRSTFHLACVVVATYWSNRRAGTAITATAVIAALFICAIGNTFFTTGEIFETGETVLTFTAKITAAIVATVFVFTARRTGIGSCIRYDFFTTPTTCGEGEHTACEQRENRVRRQQSFHSCTP